ncbi:conserved exported hypothetical protein [Cupriavidus taiwanensis]|uniref:Uncharacterized protein n=1 Tax=Cupriavidus taiwanensis TaxID=164546 RepID=A0A976A873_9BURK|nr:hypothetical protein [Cupriavidus taiwanensis]SOY67478.1 conserved exported hypothetical protein [Cupriavidus taiwanensis]
MRRPGATALAAWLSVPGLAALCAVALAGWLDPAHAQAWIALLALCQ